MSGNLFYFTKSNLEFQRIVIAYETPVKRLKSGVICPIKGGQNAWAII